MLTAMRSLAVIVSVIGATLIVLSLCYQGVQISVVDSRGSRAELAQAFGERDKAIDTLLKAIQQLEKTKAEKEPK
jgi:hypothetical protein